MYNAIVAKLFKLLNLGVLHVETVYNPLNVANNILEKAFNEKITVTNMKLQKLLYFIYRDYYKLTNKQIFSERFEAWKYGPVLSCVYTEFKRYGAKPITSYSKDSDGIAFKVVENSDEDFSYVLINVWNKYKHKTGIDLSDITHKKGTAWHKAWMGDELFLSDENIAEENTSVEGQCIDD